MSDLIAIPTVEQINLEHRLAFNKAGEAVQHATNCGLMLLQIKASLSHGEWLPWLNGTIDRGELTFGIRQAQKYIRRASNTNSSSYLEDPAIQEALEIFSDKPEAVDQQPDLLQALEAERAARLAAEQEAAAESADKVEHYKARREAEEKIAEEQRICKLSQAESNERRKKIRELEHEVNTLKAAEPVIEVVPPADYEEAKAQATKLKEQLTALKAKQADLVQQQLISKLKEREKELADLARLSANAKALLDSLNKQIDGYSSIERMTRLQFELIEKTRSALVDLAANLEGMKSLGNPEADRQWDALQDMLHHGALAVGHFRGHTQPALTVIRGI